MSLLLGISREGTCAAVAVFDPMNEASTNGALSRAEKMSVRGHRFPSSPLRSIIVIAWLGTIASVQSQSERVDR
jgi:hypothetical protein